MSHQSDFRQAAARVLDPSEVEGVLSARFYGGPVAAPTIQEQAPAAKNTKKPTHYKVICISMYTDDLQRLDQMVDELKAKGLTKANRSALIRYALGQVDLEHVPRGL